MNKKLLIGLSVLIIMASSIMALASNEETTKIVKDNTYELGTEKNPYVILEIVPHKAYGEIGYLVKGQEPISLSVLQDKNKFIEADKILGDCVKVSADRLDTYKILKNVDETTNSVIDFDSSVISVNGYYTNVGTKNGDWKANYTEDEPSDGYLAKSFEKDNSKVYNYVYVEKDKTYYKIIDTYANDYFRYDKNTDTYFSKWYDETYNIVLEYEPDYAYIALEDINGDMIFRLLSDVSTDRYRKVDNAKKIKSFTYVGANNGDWSFTQAFDKKQYKYSNYTFQYDADIPNDNLNTWMYLRDEVMDCGKGTVIKGKALCEISNSEITNIKIENNDLFKKNVLNIKDNLDSYIVKVVTKIPEEVTERDIYNSNLIYLNNGGNQESTRYKTIAKLYADNNVGVNIWDLETNGEASMELSANYARFNSFDDITSAIFTKAVFGADKVSIDEETGMEFIDENNKAIVVFDSDLIKGFKGWNTEIHIETEESDNIIESEFTQNDFTKLYLYMNQMYPTAYYKNYLQHKIEYGKPVDLTSYDRLDCTPTYSLSKDFISIEANLPYDTYGLWGIEGDYELMGIDNPFLTEEFVVEHGVYSFSSSKVGTLISSFNTSIIGNDKTTSEAFTIYKDKETITPAEALNYLVNNQITNNIKRNELRLLEIEPCNSFDNTDWSWRLSGLAPYYLGKIAPMFGSTDEVSYDTRLSRQVSTNQFIGMVEDINDKYDLVYIGDNCAIMPQYPDTPTPRKNVYFIANKNKVLEIDANELTSTYQEDMKFNTHISVVKDIEGEAVLDEYNADNSGVCNGDNFKVSFNNNIAEFTGYEEGIYNVVMYAYKEGINSNEPMNTEGIEFSIYVIDENKEIEIDTSKEEDIEQIEDYETIVDFDLNNLSNYSIGKVDKTTGYIDVNAKGRYIKTRVKPNTIYTITLSNLNYIWHFNLNINIYDKDNNLLGYSVELCQNNSYKNSFSTFDNAYYIVLEYAYRNESLYDTALKVLGNKFNISIEEENTIPTFRGLDTSKENTFTNSKSWSAYVSANNGIIDEAQEKGIMAKNLIVNSTNTASAAITNESNFNGLMSIEPDTWYIWKNYFYFKDTNNKYNIKLLIVGDKYYDVDKYNVLTNAKSLSGFQIIDTFEVAWDRVVGNTYGNKIRNATSIHNTSIVPVDEKAFLINNHDNTYDLVFRTDARAKYITYCSTYTTKSEDKYNDYNKFIEIFGEAPTIIEIDKTTITDDTLYFIETANGKEAKYNILDYMDSRYKDKIYDINIEIQSNNKAIRTDGALISFKTDISSETNIYDAKAFISYKLEDDTEPYNYMNVINIKIVEKPKMQTVEKHTFNTAYNDTSMDGLIYSHVGDSYIIGRRNTAGNSPRTLKDIDGNDLFTYDELSHNPTFTNNELDGAINKDGTSDVGKGNYITTRLQGNDITERKMLELKRYIGSGFPIILADSLVKTENNKIVSANDDTVDNSSNLSIFINDCKDLLFFESSHENNIWQNVFTNSIDVKFLNTPNEYDETKGDEAYLINSELLYEFNLNSGMKIDNNYYKVNIYIDTNCDGNFNDNEELKGLQVTNSKGEVVNSERLRANTGETYVVRRDISKDYIGAIIWKIVISRVDNDNIRVGFNGNSAIKTNKIYRPDIVVLQILPVGTFNGKITLNMETNETFLELTDAIQDFNIHTIALTENDIINEDGKVKDIIAFKTTTKIYESDDMQDIVDKEVIAKSGEHYQNGCTVTKLSDMTQTEIDETIENLSEATLLKVIDETDHAYYIYEITQGIGMQDINNYSDTDAYNTVDEVVSFDMICLGFGDYCLAAQNDDLIDKIYDHIKNGKSLLLTHDQISFSYMSVDPMSKLTIKLREALGMDRYAGIDEAYTPNSNRSTILYNEAHAFNNISMTGQFSGKTYTPDQYTPYSSDIVSGSDTSLRQITFNSYNIECINRGQITDYPYYISNKISVAPTHPQYWQLDLELPDIGVWYTLAPKDYYDSINNAIRYCRKDTRSLYYIYNKGNITYTGVGHSTVSNIEEMKLFVNTIVSSYRNSVQPSTIVIDNVNASIAGNDTYIYIDEDYLGGVEDEINDSEKLQFHMLDTNIITEARIGIDFGILKDTYKEDGVSVNLLNYSKVTKSVYNDDYGEKLRVYKYTDDISDAVLLEPDENGYINVDTSSNYYIVLPSNIIKWAKEQCMSESTNSYVIYAKIRLDYNKRTEDNGDYVFTKKAEGIQRIVFIKRDLFLMD